MPFTTTTSARIVLFISAALVACMCLVKAAPSPKAHGLIAVSPIHVNNLKKVVHKGKFTGRTTYYNTADQYGSCGWIVHDSEMIVALNYKQMKNGANPNHNPKCGRTITVNGPKGSVIVTVADTCPGCPYGGLDLSPVAFAKLANISLGFFQASWSWNS